MIKKLLGIIFLLLTVVRLATFQESVAKSRYKGELKDYYAGGLIVSCLVTAGLAWYCLRPASDS